MREQRSISVPFAADGNRLVGYAAVWDSPTRIAEQGRVFTETIRAGAFARSLKENPDIIATYNHNPDRILGRTKSGTLRLSEDERGLRFEIDLPESETVLRELVARGDINGASFTFAPRAGGEAWSGNNRELRDVYLYELGPVTLPAYEDTSVGLRSGDAMRKKELELRKKRIDIGGL
jgi:HK97 family phage prohead protease